ncbi:peptidoglycan recognition protein family protein [Kocuria sp.]|uniref:peptidoglycan recognition protein family protein n=1 Tax=Kocuria sp. TaxID=1871328 RepID=UPI0026DFF6DB|nr:N-acetylmuramoyl-L-alanine amidase [Kocuria sp.]MDO5618916.1 N-acetylmuramoyl-L-alanine amidase [Kocuria sp.]
MKPTRQPAPSLNRRNLLRGSALLGAAGALALTTAAPGWAAGLAAPSSLVATTAWGAQPPRGELVTHGYRPTFLVIDQTWTANTGAYSLGAAQQVARAAQDAALAQGQPDSAHHFLIARGSQIMEGRHGSMAAAARGDSFVEGSLIGGHNAQVVTVLVEGDYSVERPTQAMYANLVHLSAYLCQQYGMAPANVRTPLNMDGQPVSDPHWNELVELLQMDVTRSLEAGAVRVSLLSSPPRGPGAAFYPVLTPGDTGDAVGRLKQLLRARAVEPGSTDWTLDPTTAAAVSTFRSNVGLSDSPVVDAATWTALEAGAARGSGLQRGASGAEVAALQRALNARLGAGLPPFGFYNLATESAVATYQRQLGLPDDGAASPTVWDALKAGR